MSIVQDLQKDALDEGVGVADLLRKALVVARKLKIKEFESWASKELNGYPDTAEAPDYRRLHGAVRAFNPYNGRWIPVASRNPAQTEAWSRTAVSQNVASLEDLMRQSKGSEQVVTFRFPPAAVAKILGEDGQYLSDLSLHVAPSCIRGILDAIRTIVLNWSLQLEEDGILGEDFSFTAAEKSAAASVSYQSINNFYGNVGVSQTQQGSTNASQTATATLPLAELGELVREISDSLPKLGLAQDLAVELRTDLTTIEAQLGSPKPKQGIIRESAATIRRILEGAGVKVASDLPTKYGPLLLSLTNSVIAG